MAKLEVIGNRVEVVLLPLEKLGALRGDVSVGLDEVADVRTSEQPFGQVQGLRAPGTGLPGVIALGTWRWRRGKPGRWVKDFVAVYRGQPAVIVETRPDTEFNRLIVSVDNPERVAATIWSALEKTGHRTSQPAN